MNPLIRENHLGNHLENYFDRKSEPRLPWQDIHVKVNGMAARDIAKNFIQRWNWAKRAKSNKNYLTLKGNEPKLSTNEKFPDCTVQVLRSAGPWSHGLRTVESSIYKAKIEAIRNSKHYIYIENQYFVSAAKNQINPKNRILEALLDRLRIAIRNKENFKLFVVLPIQVAAPIQDLTPRFLTFWNYAAISRGKFSLFKILSKEFPKEDINNYVHFGSLRTFDFFKDGRPVTEMIYVHSKLMIVDDRIVIIGSANINDRSLVGNRDSELGVIIEDTNTEITKMGGNDFTVSKFGHSLRMDLWRYHLGLKKDKSEDYLIKDPISFFHKWKEIADKNTNLFLEVFQKLHDNVFLEKDLKLLIDYGKKIKPQNVHKLKLIQGHLVNFPLDFLKDSNIYGSIIDALDILLV